VNVGEPGGDDGHGYNATVTFSWDTTDAPHPARIVIAHLLADRAVQLVRYARLAAQASAAAEKAANLQIALASNREIGQAMGILMSSYKLTSQQAFDVLKRHSQDTNRKLHDIARVDAG
jgi:hypothetical protein